MREERCVIDVSVNEAENKDPRDHEVAACLSVTSLRDAHHRNRKRSGHHHCSPVSTTTVRLESNEKICFLSPENTHYISNVVAPEYLDTNKLI